MDFIILAYEFYENPYAIFLQNTIDFQLFILNLKDSFYQTFIALFKRYPYGIPNQIWYMIKKIFLIICLHLAFQTYAQKKTFIIPDTIENKDFDYIFEIYREDQHHQQSLSVEHIYQIMDELFYLKTWKFLLLHHVLYS